MQTTRDDREWEWVENPLCPLDISPKYDIEIMYADSAFISAGFGGDSAMGKVRTEVLPQGVEVRFSGLARRASTY